MNIDYINSRRGGTELPSPIEAAAANPVLAANIKSLAGIILHATRMAYRLDLSKPVDTVELDRQLRAAKVSVEKRCEIKSGLHACGLIAD